MSPDDLVRDYGCDSLRMYELFVGPPELDAEWDDRGIDGVNRFLKRLWNLLQDSKDRGYQGDERDDQAPSQDGLRHHKPSGELQPEYGYLRFHGVQQQVYRSCQERGRHRQRDAGDYRSARLPVRTALRGGDVGAA